MPRAKDLQTEDLLAGRVRAHLNKHRKVRYSSHRRLDLENRGSQPPKIPDYFFSNKTGPDLVLEMTRVFPVDVAPSASALAALREAARAAGAETGRYHILVRDRAHNVPRLPGRRAGAKVRLRWNEMVASLDAAFKRARADGHCWTSGPVRLRVEYDGPMKQLEVVPYFLPSVAEQVSAALQEWDEKFSAAANAFPGVQGMLLFVLGTRFRTRNGLRSEVRRWASLRRSEHRTECASLVLVLAPTSVKSAFDELHPGDESRLISICRSRAALVALANSYFGPNLQP